MSEKVVLITGSSSGIGFLTSIKFARNNWRVIASMRNITGEGSEKLRKVSEVENLKIDVVTLDVNDTESVHKTVKHIIDKYDHIDVVINNAGFGYLGPVEEFDIEEVQSQYDTNVMGVLRVTQECIPHMRTAKSGLIINISSIAGLIPFPLYGVYSSSKFALESLSEALAFELKQFGIDVVIVEPGSFETEFSKNIKISKNHKEGSPYKKLSRSFSQRFSKIKPKQDPEKIANLLFKLTNIKFKRLRYLIGMDAKFYYLLKKTLPPEIWFILMRIFYKW